MTSGKGIIRLSAAVAVGVASCIFVSQYGWASEAQYNMEHGKPLPILTSQVLRLAPYAYALPASSLLVGVLLLRSKRHSPLVFESVLALGWVFAFVWSLVAVFSWQLTRVPSGP